MIRNVNKAGFSHDGDSINGTWFKKDRPDIQYSTHVLA
jgi:hypothetical protein